jgi:sugar lactone lactonase YvrE
LHLAQRFRAAVLVACVAPLVPAEGRSQITPRLEESRRLSSEAITAYRNGEHARFAAKIDSALALRPNHPTFVYNVAAARALEGDTTEAVRLLDRLASWGLSYDPALDSDFEALNGAPPFERVRELLTANGRPVGSATRVVELDDPQMLPEALAHDLVTGDLFLGSVRHRTILRIRPDGSAALFVDGVSGGMPAPLSMVVDPVRRVLWVSGSRMPESDQHGDDGSEPAGPDAEVRAYDLETGQLRRVVVPPDPRVRTDASGTVAFAAGDIGLEPSGSVLVSDWRSGALLRVVPDSDTLAIVLPPGSLGSPQGIVPSADGRIAWIADYALGLVRVDLKRAVSRVVLAATTLLGSDALLAYGDDLIVVQNGVTPARILRIALSADRTEVAGHSVLLAAHPDFAEPAGAVIAGDALLIVANGHWSHFAGGEVRRPEDLTEPIILRQDLMHGAP